MKRRQYLKTILTPFFLSQIGNSKSNSSPTIILRSGWQPINIGDITHSPGVIRLINTYIPEAQVVFWPFNSTDEVDAMLQHEFPDLKIVHGGSDGNGMPQDEEIRKIYEYADLFMHGSGAGVYLHSNMRAWHEIMKKPYGTYGVTVSNVNDDIRSLLQNAAFVFCRETLSVYNVKTAGINKPIVDFAPDGTFAIELLNEAKAEQFLAQKGLKEKEFICVIPRLRYTPYHKLREVGWSQERIDQVETTNEKYAETDHAKLRYVITEWVRQTGKQVLLCPEMTYQLDVIDPLLYNPLPDDVKKNVKVRETFWLPDEAASVYKRAHTVISVECHSPIIASTVGTPAFYVRQPEDTIKGQMYYDIGLDDWVFEIDEITGQDIFHQLMKVNRNYTMAKLKQSNALRIVRERHRQSMNQIRNVIGV